MQLQRRKLLFIIILPVISCIFCGCLFLPIDNEVQRISTQDGRIDAVYIQRNAGAMTSVKHLIYIVPSGEKIKEDNIAVFQGNRVFDLEFTWINNNTLQIRYSKATINHFQNYIYPFPNDSDYMVNIQEIHSDTTKNK